MTVTQATVDLYQEHAKRLIGYASTLVGPSQAEDLVADAMVAVFARVDLADVANPQAYLFACVLNQARSDARAQTSRRRRERLVSGASRSAPPPEAADELGLLASLSTRERAVVYLTYWEDQTVAEVADCLGVGDGTVRRYLARARAKIRQELR
ncbi:MAG: sigma-70 family RNA polymerase sigma factor [Actinomycetota bacterium]